MRNKIYISGPITDPQTGQPREGWEAAFNAVESELKSRGYDVISPVHISEEVIPEFVADIPRRTWIRRCIGYIWADAEYDRLLGTYVIGDPQRARESYGVMCEVNFSLAAGIPVFVREFGERQVNNELCPIKAKGLKTYTRELRRVGKKYSVRPGGSPDTPPQSFLSQDKKV